jgi:hypothetical protein
MIETITPTKNTAPPKTRSPVHAPKLQVEKKLVLHEKNSENPRASMIPPVRRIMIPTTST